MLGLLLIDSVTLEKPFIRYSIIQYLFRKVTSVTEFYNRLARQVFL